jgi:hypothetical protein
MRFEKVLSLGYACDVAHQIRRILKQTESYPFDWLLTPINALQSMIQTDFENFLEEEYLCQEKNYVLDRQSGIKYLHDFKNLPEWSNDTSAVKDKYRRRIDRWLELMTQDMPALFVRGQKENDRLPSIDHAGAVDLLNIINQKYPSIKAHLLVIQPIDSLIPDFKGDTITMVKMPSPNPAVWSGDNEKWESLISEVCG